MDVKLRNIAGKTSGEKTEKIPSDLEPIFIDENEIKRRVAEIDREISKDYSAGGSIYITGILKGAFIFLTDLVRALDIPHVVDFMSVSSYGNSATNSGEVRLMIDLREPIANKHVLIIEDTIVNRPYT